VSSEAETTPPEAEAPTLSKQQQIEKMVPVATALVIIYAVVGGALVVLSAALNHINPTFELTYKEYLQQMAIAAGALSIGRGLTANAKGAAS
jgi:hypothetical protein